MKKIILSLLLISSALIFAEKDNNFLINAAKKGDREELSTLFTKEDKPQGRIVELAFQEAVNATQSKEVLLFLLQHCPSKNGVLMDACRLGKQNVVKLILEEDSHPDLMLSSASHQHIIEAKNAGYKDIAKMIQTHLVTKGYTHASTIELD